MLTFTSYIEKNTGSETILKTDKSNFKEILSPLSDWDKNLSCFYLSNTGKIYIRYDDDSLTILSYKFRNDFFILYDLKSIDRETKHTTSYLLIAEPGTNYRKQEYYCSWTVAKSKEIMV